MPARSWTQLWHDMEQLCSTMRSSHTLQHAWHAACAQVQQALQSNRTVFFAGNGGSAADACHLAAELVCRYRHNRAALPAVALGTNAANVTAIANDLGYTHVFARELEALAQPGDVLWAMSTSGRSPNILEVLQTAHRQHIPCIGLTGLFDDAMAPWCRVVIKVPSSDTARIQEVHKVLGHALCAELEAWFLTQPQHTPNGCESTQNSQR